MTVPVKAGNRPVGDWGVPENWRSVPENGQSVPVDAGDHFAFDDYLTAGQGEEEFPLMWTPELVQVRMREAFETNRRSGGRVGPIYRSGTWPAALVEFADMIDAEAREAAERRMAMVRTIPTSAEISRMEMVLAWPIRFLRQDPLQADALLTWAYGQIRAGGVVGILKDRAALVSARVKAVHDGAQAERHAIAFRIAAETNAMIAAAKAAGDVEAARAARASAHSRFSAAIANAPHMRQPMMTRADALPNKILSRTRLDHHRKRAAAKIANGLNVANEEVWS